MVSQSTTGQSSEKELLPCQKKPLSLRKRTIQFNPLLAIRGPGRCDFGSEHCQIGRTIDSPPKIPSDRQEVAKSLLNDAVFDNRQINDRDGVMQRVHFPMIHTQVDCETAFTAFVPLRALNIHQADDRWRDILPEIESLLAIAGGLQFSREAGDDNGDLVMDG